MKLGLDMLVERKSSIYLVIFRFLTVFKVRPTCFFELELKQRKSLVVRDGEVKDQEVVGDYY